MGRRLIYIPIIHTEVDMGSLAESLKKEYIKKYGIHKWEQHLKKINDLWTGIEERLNQKNLRYNQVKVYQDGLPVCGKELEIVRDIANSGGRNHQLLLKLIHEGATGVLFLGMLHKVDEKLPSDIVIDYLIYHLPFKEAVSKKKNL